MKTIEHWIVGLLFLLFGAIGAMGGNWIRQKLGVILGAIMMQLDSKRKRVTLKNLKHAFPELSKHNILDLCKKSYHNLGIVFVETCSMYFLSPRTIAEMVEYENPELLIDAAKQQSGIMLISGHFGNWEALAFSAGLICNSSISIVVKSQRNPLVNRFLEKIRTKGGNTTAKWQNAAKNIVQTLQNKGAVALLVDQAAEPGKDIFVKFFGRQALTHKAPAQLALRYNIPIIFGCAVRKSNGKYLVVLHRIDRSQEYESESGRIELTERLTFMLEQEIRKTPHLWAWQHRRWKYGSSSNF